MPGDGINTITVRVDTNEVLDYLAAAARVRGISSIRLMSVLLVTIQGQDKIDDILQDAGYVYPRQKREPRSPNEAPNVRKHSNIRAELAALRERLGIPEPRVQERVLNSRVVQSRDMRKTPRGGFVPSNRRESEADLRQAVENTADL